MAYPTKADTTGGGRRRLPRRRPAARGGGPLLLLQHGLALALDGALDLVGNLRQRPRKHHFQPRVIFGDIDRAVGGLADGVGMALMQVMAFDPDGNHLGASFMDYLLPTSLECPSWELGETVTPSPHHPLGAKGIGESPNVGSPAAFVNAVVDALSHLGVRHIDMPIAPWKVWQILKEKGVAS